MGNVVNNGGCRNVQVPINDTLCVVAFRPVPGVPSPAPQAEFWRNLALTRKQKLTVRIPKRQFIGKSEELTKSINEKIEQEIINILGL